MKQLVPGVFLLNRKLFTKNSVMGFRLFKEQVIKRNQSEFVEWNPFHSKLAAGIKNGLNIRAIRPGTNILYLGCSEGKTVQHLSNIVGKQGIIFGVDVSETAMKRFLELCEERENIIPVLADATNPGVYAPYLKKTNIGVLVQDIAQKNQAEIFNKNAAAFLKKGATGLIAIKAKSISQSKKTSSIFSGETKILRKEFNIIQTISLTPFEKDHVVVLCKKK